jgi:hypothetical protein
VSKSGLSDAFAFTAFTVVVLTLCAVAVANLRRAGTGRRFLAVRANERAAAAAGVNVARTKLLAFAISSALAGVAGVLLGFQQQSISSANFAVLLGLTVLAFAYLGGITSINGALVAGLIGTSGLLVVFSKYHIQGIEQYTSVLGGIGLILTAIVHPEGIAPFFQPLLQSLGRFLLHARAKEWGRVAVRLGPTALVGALLAWVLWTRRPGYTWWMTALGAALALVIRANALQVARAVRKPKTVALTSPTSAGSDRTVDDAVDVVSVGGGR